MATLASKSLNVFTLHGIKHAEAIVWGRRNGYLGVRADAGLQHYMLPRFKNIIAISPYVKEMLPKEKRIFEVPNPVASMFFKPVTEPPPLSGKFLLFAGAVTPLKRPMDLLLAARALQKERPELKIVICGNPEDQDYYNSLRTQVEESNITGVHFTGHVTQNQLKVYLKHAAALVLPSAQENSPMVIAEAMVLGTPVVATNIGGVPYMIKHDHTGLLFSVGDIDALVHNLVRLLDNTELRSNISRQAQAEARIKYAPDRVAAATINVYRELLGC